MKVYLVQHAEPKRKEEDPLRSISDKGREDIQRVAKFVKGCLGIHVDKIVHSGKVRAKQTAEVIGEYLSPSRGIKMDDDLQPLADPKIWGDRLFETSADIMIVGHLPHLGKLVSYLITSDESKGIVAFRMAGIVCLDRNESHHWTVQWMITPEMVP
ncbi:MAG: phosphohistidine phosphatase SixA [Candidatus Bathyarchaeota archaeon]|nr:MAG: phosphohistidine phosphatase SixA [Candidatus Bathyarchaeota archaeon]